MSSNLATIVRRLQPGRSRGLSCPVKLATERIDGEIDFRTGPEVATVLTGGPALAQRSVAPSDCEQQQGRLLDMTIKFVRHPSFDDSAAAAEILGPMPGSARRARTKRASETPEALGSGAALYLDDAFLTREQEVHLFRKLNFLKYRAAQIRAEIEPGGELGANRDRVAEMLREVSAIQDRIMRSYLRLVVSIVKSWIQPGEDFFELVSDGNMAMVRALERFDFARGRRFSTYATWAVTNDFARRIPRERNRRRRYLTGREELLQVAIDDRDGLAETEELDQFRQVAQTMLGRLTEREQVIINRRFGLTGEKQTLDQLGKELGISKERVRQIESRAVNKLRGMAEVQKLGPVDGRGRESRRRVRSIRG